MTKEGQLFDVLSAESIQDEPEIRNYPGWRMNRDDHGRIVGEEVLAMSILDGPEFHPGRGTNNGNPGGIVLKESQLVEALLAESIPEVRISRGTMSYRDHVKNSLVQTAVDKKFLGWPRTLT